jgi:AcrR family transcriptional regulator
MLTYRRIDLSAAYICVIGTLCHAAVMARPRKPAAKPRRTYHHGDLRHALVEEALRLAAEGGPEAVTVREVARRAGVSSGAPFRHFPDRTTLLTAVAEEAMKRFRQEILRALEAAADKGPLERLRAIGSAYLRWAVRHPTFFEVISSRRLIDFEGSAALRADNEAVQRLMAGLIEEARLKGEVRDDADARLIVVTGRALVYGLARMKVDDHYASWGLEAGEVERMMDAALGLFVSGLAVPPRVARKRRAP